uniref:Uncharacterized protein n=1 Tax=viral metagenome TaxID=1070528 RepID=A0A6C0ECX8_9ZZZZ
MACDNPTTSQLISLCSCQKAANALAESLKIQEAEVTAYKNRRIDYEAKYTAWQKTKETWDTNRQNERNNLGNQEIEKRCGTLGASERCQGGWHESGKGQHGCALALESIRCKRDGGQIDQDLGGWLAANPEPKPPAGGDANGVYQACSTCDAPSGNNLLCCSQLFTDISANKVDIKTAQTCEQKITNQITNIQTATTAPAPGSTSSAPGSTTTPPASLSLTYILTYIQNWISSNPLLAGGGCCCCLIVCILLIIVMSSSD